MEKLFQCYIIDDEPDSRSLIRKFVEKVPFLNLVGESGNVIEALFEVKKLIPDLIFLDVEMPDINGFEFIESLGDSKPQIIMISAYAQYALEGFEHQVLDYLLKPVSFPRFLKAVNRIQNPEIDERIKSLEISNSNHINNLKSDVDYILIKSGKKHLRISVKEILILESMKDYVKIHLTNRTIVTYTTLTNLSDIVPSNLFLRINRSYIIQINSIVELEGNEITISNGKKIDIGITYRESVFNTLRPFNRQN